MLEILERLRSIESEKRALAVGTPRFVELAAEAEGLSRDVFRWSQFQDDLARLSADRRNTGEVSGRPIDASEPRPLQQLLADWREAEIRLQRLAPGSPEAISTTREIERLRDQYRAIHDTKIGREED